MLYILQEREKSTLHLLSLHLLTPLTLTNLATSPRVFMAVDGEFSKNNRRAPGNDRPLAWTPVPPIFFDHTRASETVAQQKTHFATSCPLAHCASLSNHIIIYKLLIAWLNITLSRGLVVCNVFFHFVPCTRSDKIDNGRRLADRRYFVSHEEPTSTSE